jgi:hypothetical protein
MSSGKPDVYENLEIDDKDNQDLQIYPRTIPIRV